MQLNVYDYSGENLTQLYFRNKQKAANVRSMRVVGSKTLKSMRGVENFTNSNVLILSGNLITKIEGLRHLEVLRDLNLSANQIKLLPDLSFLTNLKVLNLSFNFIASIEELGKFEGKGLRRVNLTGNKINNLKQLKILDKIDSLEEVWFQDFVSGSNPICQNSADYYSEVVLLMNFKRMLVDGKKSSEILGSLQNGDPISGVGEGKRHLPLANSIVKQQLFVQGEVQPVDLARLSDPIKRESRDH